MGAFGYVVLDASGRQHRGTLEADSARQARQQLRDRGLVPLQVTESGTDSSVRGDSGRGSRTALATAELASFTRQLATLLQAALPLADALAAIAQQGTRPGVGALVTGLRGLVVEGRGLAAAMGFYPRAFAPMYRATVAAGEHSGRLDLVLARLADHAEATHRSQQKVRLALIYPALLLTVALLVVAGLLTWVVPDVVAVFADEGQQLPAATRALLALSNFVVGYGLWLLAGFVLAVLAARLALREPARRERMHRTLLGAPLAGRLITTAESARFAGTLSTLVSSGVPLVEALGIAAAVLSNLHLGRVVAEAAAQVREGASLRTALARSGCFPPMMIYMIASGETSGELERMLARVADSQRAELDERVATLLGLLEPAVLLFMGVVVFAIVVAILQPVFSLNQLI
ncbi:MAG: Type II secretion system protein F [Pseudomonadales bacterium]|nr:Type II secretion system protein F [Pseudomonadales bacterium]